MKHLVKLISTICLMLLTMMQTIAAQQTGDIHKAVAAGDLNRVRAFIEADSTLLELKDKNGKTPLNLACFTKQIRSREPAIAKFLIDKGANVNTKSNDGITPLYGACVGSGPDFELIQLLIARGADINAKNNNSRTPLLEITSFGNLEIARFMIEHGADISDISLDDAITYPANDGMAKLLIESGAKINQRDPQSNTELHLAAMRGFADQIRLLLEKGADVSAINKDGHTALYYAAKHGYRSAVGALIAEGADESNIIENNYGKAPQLTSKLKRGEAYLWYIKGGYAVKTKGHLLLFCLPVMDESLEASLANGHLNPNELAGQKIIVFSPYPSGEPFKSWTIEFAKRMPKVDWAFITTNSNEDSLNIPSYRLVGPNESLSIEEGVQVHTIPGVYGGAQLMAYLVEADGVKVFFGGNHVCTNEAKVVEKYHKEIDFLKPFGPADIAILRVRGHFPNDYEPYLYLLDQLSPKAVYLMGGNGVNFDEYAKCTKILQTSNIYVRHPEGRIEGDRFHYLRDSIPK
jgi:ankyrin repeat protein